MARGNSKKIWNGAWQKLKRIRKDDVRRFAKYYDDQKLNSKVSSSIGVLGESVLMPVLRAYYILKSPKTPTLEKVYLVGALGYFILPTDFIPDFLGLFGYADDLAVIAFILHHVKKHATEEIEAEARRAYRKLFNKLGKKYEA